MSTTKPTQTPATTARSPFPATLTTPIVRGAACWVLTLTYFVGQAVTQFAVRTPYSLTTNEISDLGSTRCGPLTVLTYHADVCSPLHGVMNGAFIAVGLLTLLGIIGTRRAWPRRRLTSWGLVFLALGGAGEIVAGLAPENVNPGLHVCGALAAIPGANIGMLLLAGAVWRARRWTALVSLLCGIVGLSGIVLIVLMGSAPSAGLGVGTAERLAAYPFAVWMIVLGVFLLWSATRAPRQHAVVGAVT